MWEKKYAPLQTANYGISGDTTKNILWRCAICEIDGLSPKSIVLMIGTNNFGISKHQPDEVIKGVTPNVADLYTRLPITKILLLAIFPRDANPAADIRTRIKTVNTAIAKLHDGMFIHSLDIGDIFTEPDGSLSKEIIPDFLHLSEQGYQRWDEAIREPLAELMK